MPNPRELEVLLGVVRSVHRYPVKSMGGERLLRGSVTSAGVVGDRVWALHDRSPKANRPWITARERPSLVSYNASFGTRLSAEQPPADLRALPLTVRAPDGTEFTAAGDELERLMEGARFSDRNMVDAYALSIIGLATIAALGNEVAPGTPLDPRRFRANLYVEWTNDQPFFEDTLVNRDLHIGEELVARVVKRDVRCKIISIDPNDARAQPEILQAVVQKHEGCAGVYASVLHEGWVREGDAIHLVT